MLKQLLKHSFRTFRRQKAYFVINTLGLAIGISCSILMMLFVLHEVSFDNYHDNKDRIYRVLLNGKIGGQEVDVSSTAAIIGPSMLEELPEVEGFLRMNSMQGTVVKMGDQSYVIQDFLEADSSFFDFFSIPLLIGNPKTALAGPHQLVLSENTAKKLFGEENPLNKSLKVGNDSIFYTVSGIMKDVPENTHFQADIIRSFMTNPRSKDEGWTNNSFETYILANNKSNPETINKGLEQLIAKYVGDELQQFMGITLEEFFAQGNKYRLYLQPLRKIHLEPRIDQSLDRPSDPKYLYIFGSVALLIIVIASINYMNLSTAQAARRAREVGIKKVSGSSRGMLIQQFLAESLVLTLIALLISLVLVKIALPYFSDLLETSLHINYFGNALILPGLLILAVVVGFLSGIYPAFFISSFKPVSVLKGTLRNSMKNGKLRSVLVIFQFSVSIALIVGTLVMYRQINYLVNKDLGFEKENLLVVRRAGVLGEQVSVFKEELKKIPGVECVSVSTAVPSYNNNNNGYQMDGREEAFLMTTNWIDYDFFKTYKIKIAGGRAFQEEFPTDQNACIINESAVREYNLENPYNERFIRNDNDENIPEYIPIIGTAQDFHFSSLHGPIQPYIFRYKVPGLYFGYVSVRLLPTANSETISQIEDIWKGLSGNEPMQYFFMDEDFKRLYKEEQQSASLAVVFSLLTIFIAALGLFGLTSFTLLQRTREIGIRKTMGASTWEVFTLIAKEVFILLGISTLIAWPAIYLFMNNWLENFYYRITMSVGEFLIGFLIAVLIALLTTGYKTLKAARANPADSLQYE